MALSWLLSTVGLAGWLLRGKFWFIFLVLERGQRADLASMLMAFLTILLKLSSSSVRERPWGKSADHQSLLPQAQRDTQREWMKLSYQSCGAITWTKLQNSEKVLNRFISVKWVIGHWGWFVAVWKEHYLRVQCRSQLIVRLIAIEYTESLLCYLSSDINLLMTNL